jgi:hypothetical protein
MGLACDHRPGLVRPGRDAGELVPIPPFYDVAEAVVTYLNAVGIRVKMRTMERAAFLSAWREKKLRGLVLTAVGASGNAATRVESFIYSQGPYAYGGYPDIDELFQQQAGERDRAKREALLHRIQQLTIEGTEVSVAIRSFVPSSPSAATRVAALCASLRISSCASSSRDSIAGTSSQPFGGRGTLVISVTCRGSPTAIPPRVCTRSAILSTSISSQSYASPLCERSC